jgi:hypothetical protein
VGWAEIRQHQHPDLLALVSFGLDYEGWQMNILENAVVGIKRSNKDKRACVELVLNDPDWRDWSNAEIARRCNVSVPLVASVRKETEEGKSK